jgi:hypothetical protein
VTTLISYAKPADLLTFLNQHSHEFACTRKAVRYVRSAARFLVLARLGDQVQNEFSDTQQVIWRKQAQRARLSHALRQEAMQCLILFFEHKVPIDPSVNIITIRRNAFKFSKDGRETDCNVIFQTRYTSRTSYVFACDWHGSLGCGCVAFTRSSCIAFRFLTTKVSDDILRHIWDFLRNTPNNTSRHVYHHTFF